MEALVSDETILSHHCLRKMWSCHNCNFLYFGKKSRYTS